MNTLFFITSCIKPKMGIFTPQERFDQTLETIRSIREKVPGAVVVLSDSSYEELGDWATELISKVDLFFYFSELRSLSFNNQKSKGEAALTYYTFRTLKENNFQWNTIDRIFKITGRLQLDDGFDISQYENLNGKYVFKKRNETWMNPPIMGATHNLDTRMYSFTPDMIGLHLNMIATSFDSTLTHLDLEHAFFVGIDKERLVEFDRVYCKGQVASTGEWKYD